MFFTDGRQKKFNCQGKLVQTHPLLFLYLWDKKKLVTNIKKLLNSYIWQSGCPNYQITAFVFFYFEVGWGWFVGDSTWLIHQHHLRHSLLDEGYKKIRLIRSLKKFIFRYQDLVEIYFVFAETIINDGFSYSENV